ncbi:MAG: ACP phosphodiesterase [Saprospiraceae bacterium]
MNFLAHFLLSYPDPELMAGNFIADFLHKKEQDALDPSLKEGVEMHQWIDTYTDSHENISQFNKFFHAAIHHYAPVATDITMDYFLYKNWSAYSEISYYDFSKYTYDALLKFDVLFPERPRNIAYRMIHGQWLRQYSSIQGIEEVMIRMNQKAKFDVDFKTTIPLILMHESEMNTLFKEFFEEAIKASKQWINLRNARKM